MHRLITGEGDRLEVLAVFEIRCSLQSLGMIFKASGHLRRVLGVGFGLSVSIGATIGVGILRTPGLVAGHLQSAFAILFLWIAGGVYTLLGASCLTELGIMLPQEGGYYVYTRRAFGDTAGFIVGWADWLMYCSILAYASIAIAEFIAMLGWIPAGAARFLGVAILIGVVCLQWLGIRVSSQFQEVTTSLKCVAFLSLIVMCLALPIHRHAAGSAMPAITVSGLVVALQAVVITYGGWQSPLYFMEEDRHPARNLPRTMIGGVLSVIAVYVLVNLALLKVLSMSELSDSTLPAAEAAKNLAGTQGGRVITILSVISLVPLLNAVVMIGSRVVFAMGRDRLFWRRTDTVNMGGTPTVALLLTTGIAIALITTGTFQRLIAMTSFFLVANYCLCCVALVVLRRREPTLRRPYRAFGYPWSAWIVVICGVIFLTAMLVADSFNGLAAVGVLAVGVVARVMFR